MSVDTVKMNASPGFVTELLAALQQLSGPCGLEWIDDTLDILENERISICIRCPQQDQVSQ